MSLMQMRVWCLQLAASRAEDCASTEEVVLAAQGYFNFIACMGDDEERPKVKRLS